MFFKITSFLQLKERSYLCFVYIDIIQTNLWKTSKKLSNSSPKWWSERNQSFDIRPHQSDLSGKIGISWRTWLCIATNQPFNIYQYWNAATQYRSSDQTHPPKAGSQTRKRTLNVRYSIFYLPPMARPISMTEKVIGEFQYLFRVHKHWKQLHRNLPIWQDWSLVNSRPCWLMCPNNSEKSSPISTIWNSA